MHAGDRNGGIAQATDYAAPASTHIRKFPSQILLLADPEFGASILAPQREAFPTGVAPAWPVPKPGVSVSAFAEACAMQWFWGRDRVIDPARPYVIVAFGRAADIGMEIARQAAAVARPPASVIRVGDAPRALSRQSVVSTFLERIRKAVAPAGAERHRGLSPRHSLLVGAAASQGNQKVTEWADRALKGFLPRQESPSFPVFDLMADRNCVRTGWIDNQRCLLRGEPATIGVTEPDEVNSFISRVAMSAVRGAQPIPSAERAALKKLDTLSDLIATEFGAAR